MTRNPEGVRYLEEEYSERKGQHVQRPKCGTKFNILKEGGQSESRAE